jgi:hypothetical protein
MYTSITRNSITLSKDFSILFGIDKSEKKKNQESHPHSTIVLSAVTNQLAYDEFSPFDFSDDDDDRAMSRCIFWNSTS